MTTNILRWGQRTLQLLQQRSDEGAFFGKKRFRAKKERIIAGAFVVAVCRQSRCAHSERARRLDARHARPSKCRKRFLVPAETKRGEAERCSRLPVPRLWPDEPAPRDHDTYFRLILCATHRA